MKNKIIIETNHETFADIYQIEILCSKFGFKRLSAFVKEEDAENHAKWLKDKKWDDYYGKIYDANVICITLFKI